MITKPDAMEQIAEIYAVIQKQFICRISGNLFIVIGLMISLIPLVEMAFQNFIDPVLAQVGCSAVIVFILRTVFYWGTFTFVSHRFTSGDTLHPAIKRAFKFNDYYPIIPVATAGMLAATGYTDLIMPLVLIFVGIFWGLIGNFTNNIILGLAAVNIAVGIGSIYLVNLHIPHFMMALVVFQGIASIVAGIALRIQQRALIS